jgi:hypothetical protein
MPRLLFDVDGPLTNGFVEQSCKFLREVCQYPDATPDNADRWEFMESYGVSADDKRRAENSFRAPGIASTLLPILVRRISSLGAKHGLTFTQ